MTTIPRGFALWSVALLTGLMMAACAPKQVTKGEKFPQMYTETPASILILPPINESTAANAKTYYATTIQECMSYWGYYVLPYEITSDILKMEGIYDTELIKGIPLAKFREYFGADAALFTTIKKWDVSYDVIAFESDGFNRLRADVHQNGPAAVEVQWDCGSRSLRRKHWRWSCRLGGQSNHCRGPNGHGRLRPICETGQLQSFFVASLRQVPPAIPSRPEHGIFRSASLKWITTFIFCSSNPTNMLFSGTSQIGGPEKKTAAPLHLAAGPSIDLALSGRVFIYYLLIVAK